MPYMQGHAGKAVQAQSVPEPDIAREDAHEEGDMLGSFVGHLYRPKATQSGLVAQFFGENGEEADMIMILNHSNYLDAKVVVHVALIKDGNGNLLKGEDGKYERIPPFRATIRRPASNSRGLVAQLFAENGPDADVVTQMNLTRYLNALTFVRIHKDTPEALAHKEFDPQVLADASQHRTGVEKKRLKQQQKKAAEAWRLLIQSSFFRKRELLKVLGSPEDFRQWVLTQPCCHPGEQPCSNRDITAFRIPDPRLVFPYVPMCNAHNELWESGQVTLPGAGTPQRFLEGEQTRLEHQWAQVRLRQLLNTPEGYNPTPSSIYNFVLEHHLKAILPGGFAVFFEEN